MTLFVHFFSFLFGHVKKKAVPLHPLLRKRESRETQFVHKSCTRSVSLAQLVEQLTLNQWVEGSSPSGDTKGQPNGCPFLCL